MPRVLTLPANCREAVQVRVDSMVPAPATVGTVLAGVLGQLGERGRVHPEHSEDVARRAGIQPADRRPDRGEGDGTGLPTTGSPVCGP